MLTAVITAKNMKRPESDLKNSKNVMIKQYCFRSLSL